jgi:hypothetical protein
MNVGRDVNIVHETESKVKNVSRTCILKLVIY